LHVVGSTQFLYLKMAECSAGGMAKTASLDKETQMTI